MVKNNFLQKQRKKEVSVGVAKLVKFNDEKLTRRAAVNVNGRQFTAALMRSLCFQSVADQALTLSILDTV